MNRRMLIAALAATSASPRASSNATPRTGEGATEPGDIQRELDDLASRGGGTLRLGGRRYGGVLTVSGADIVIDGEGGTLLDTRLIIAADARKIIVRNLTLLETRGDPESYLLDVAGTDCQFDHVRLEKRPQTGGYQGYLRATSRNCRFTRLSLKGSNGLFVAGQDHVFDGFEFISTLRYDIGGDDAFAIKGPGSHTRNIVIRDGIVRGYAAAVSIGSEIGSNAEFPGAGKVSEITVDNVVADRCQMLAFIKPGALIYDWRNGVVENVTLTRMRLTDRNGFLFANGINIRAARGAIVRGITARDVTIDARARLLGAMPTAAVNIMAAADGAPVAIENVDLSLAYCGAGAAGHHVDYIVRIEKENPSRSLLRNIVLDVVGSHSRIAGIYIGAGLNDAVRIRSAVLDHIGEAPPSSLGAAGIWADSSFRQDQLSITTVGVPARGGRAFE